MAVRSRRTTLHFLVLFLLFSSTCLQVHCIQNYLGSCGLTIDLVLTTNIQSGTLKMTMPDSMDKYQNPALPLYCDIIISFTSGMNLLLELYFLDIMPKSGDIKTCSTGLEIFDQTGRKYYGGRLCMEGWQWEERHREKQQEKMVVQNSPLTFRLVSEGPYRGEGFRLHFNQFRPYWPCYTREFKCQQIQRCVHDDLTCDGWDDCGDYSDERIDAGCELLTASEICSIIMGAVLLLGAAGQIVVYCFVYRRNAPAYSARSESKIPIAAEKYNMEPVLGIGRRYNSQDSLPSRYSRSTTHTNARRGSDADTIDKADLEKADRMSNKAGDNMSERSYRSNPRRTIAQSLGTEPEPIKKSGQYSYGSRKGLNSSHSSLNRDKVEPGDNSGDRGSLEKDRLGSRDRISEKDRRYGRDRDRYSDSDEYDRDRYDDRRRRSSRERDRRRSGRYSDEDDSDYDRDYRRRRRRSYDRYSDDSDYEYERERERRRRSRERYSRDRYSDEDDSDVDRDRGVDDEKDRDRPPRRRRDSRERSRGRDRYDRDRYDDDDDTDRDNKKDKDARDSRERDRDRYRDSYDDDYDDRRARRRRSQEKRRGPSAERDKLGNEISRNEKMRSRSRENVQQREMDLPPPYTEDDINRVEKQDQKQSSFGDDKKVTGQQNQPPPPSDVPRRIEQQYPSSEELRRIEQQIQKPPSSDKKVLESQKPPRTAADTKQLESQNKKPPPTAADTKQLESQNKKPPPTAADTKRLESQNRRPPPKEIDEVDRRRSTDNRRDRYSRDRWTPKKKVEDIPPPEYEDVAPKSTFVGIAYKEESV